MPKTYRIRTDRPIFIGRRSNGRWILAVAGLLVGLVVGVMASWVIQAPIAVEEEMKRDKAEKTLEMYREFRSAFLELLQWIQKPTKGDEDRLRAVESRLNALEEGIAEAEGRTPAQIRILLPPSPEPSPQPPSRPKAEAGALLKGRVTDLNGAPVAGVEVILGPRTRSRTGQDGEFRIPSLPEGDYLLRIQAEGGESVQRWIQVGGESEEKTLSIVFPDPVQEMAFCRGLRRPSKPGGEGSWSCLGRGTVFPQDVGRLICFTHVVGAQEPLTIFHRWYWRDKLQTEISLRVEGPRWRTFSEKQILPHQTGPWKVEVVRAKDGAVLHTGVFAIEE